MATAGDVVMVVNQLNTIASGEGDSDGEAESGENQVSITVGPTLAFAGSSLRTPSAVAARAPLADPSAAAWDGSLAAEDDLSVWNRLVNIPQTSGNAAPQRSVFDAWDAEGEDLESALDAISQRTADAEREAAIDTLLGGLFD